MKMKRQCERSTYGVYHDEIVMEVTLLQHVHKRFSVLHSKRCVRMPDYFSSAR
jgi:hypothetical protein